MQITENRKKFSELRKKIMRGEEITIMIYLN